MSTSPPLACAWRFLSLPNLVTYGSLAAALLSIHFAASGALHLTAACWALAAIADNFDGAFARLFKRSPAEQEFGQELDSLADAVAFGLAPIAGLRLLTAPASAWEWGLLALGAMAYLLALVTRLGHFNIAHRRGHTAFSGLPSTEAALALATVLLWPGALPYMGGVLLVIAVLMVSPIPIRRPRGLGLAALLLWLLAVPALHLSAHAGLWP